jgi:hypothetical protein
MARAFKKRRRAGVCVSRQWTAPTPARRYKMLTDASPKRSKSRCRKRFGLGQRWAMSSTASNNSFRSNAFETTGAFRR